MINTNNKWLALSDKAITASIGTFIKQKRLQVNKSQAQLAREAGLNRWTLGQIEKGESITLSSLVQILRVLDQLHLLDIFTIEDRISPLEYAKMKEKKKMRARTKNAKPNINEVLEW